jgi:hypothetical protein
MSQDLVSEALGVQLGSIIKQLNWSKKEGLY